MNAHSVVPTCLDFTVCQSHRLGVFGHSTLSPSFPPCFLVLGASFHGGTQVHSSCVLARRTLPAPGPVFASQKATASCAVCASHWHCVAELVGATESASGQWPEASVIRTLRKLEVVTRGSGFHPAINQLVTTHALPFSKAASLFCKWE